MKDCLKPHRNLEAEKQLKEIILQIQSLMNKSENTPIIEKMLKEAAKFIKASDRILDLTVIEDYESWTDLDGLVCGLTMEIPQLPTVSKEDFISIVQYIREVIESRETPDNMPLDCWRDFYIVFFTLNFPNVDSDDLFEEMFEDTSIDTLVDMVFGFVKFFV